jgi:hypothetical protein
MWLHNKKFKTINICTTATLWAIWKFINELCFQVPGGQLHAPEKDRNYAPGVEATDQGTMVLG